MDKKILELVEKYGIRIAFDFSRKKGLTPGYGQKPTSNEIELLKENRLEIIDYLENQGKEKKEKEKKEKETFLNKINNMTSNEIGNFELKKHSYDGYSIYHIEDISKRNDCKEFLSILSEMTRKTSNSFQETFLEKYDNSGNYDDYNSWTDYCIPFEDLESLSKNAKTMLEGFEKEEEKKKTDKKEKEEQRRKKIFELAKETGEKQLLYSYSIDCQSRDEECDVDNVCEWALSNGKTEKTISHSW